MGVVKALTTCGSKGRRAYLRYLLDFLLPSLPLPTSLVPIPLSSSPQDLITLLSHTRFSELRFFPLFLNLFVLPLAAVIHSHRDTQSLHNRSIQHKHWRHLLILLLTSPHNFTLSYSYLLISCYFFLYRHTQSCIIPHLVLHRTTIPHKYSLNRLIV